MLKNIRQPLLYITSPLFRISSRRQFLLFTLKKPHLSSTAMAKDATPARADPARPNVSTVVCQESTAPATAPSDAVADEAIAAGPAIAIPMPVAIRATEATISAVLIGFCLTQFQALRHQLPPVTQSSSSSPSSRSASAASD